jgi:hypothetical protein
MSGTWIPECEKCGSVEHNGLQQICDNNEDQDVLNVCDKCYKKTCKGEDYDATDIILLQFPELWDNTMKTFYDVFYYGAEPPKQTYKCFVCKKMTTFVEGECCDACDAKTKAYAASLKRRK